MKLSTLLGGGRKVLALMGFVALGSTAACIETYSQETGSFDYDLQVTLVEYPLQMTVGEVAKGNVVVNVKNCGSKSIRDNKYSLALFVDEAMLVNVDTSGEYLYTHNLNPGQSYNFYLNYSMPTTQGDKILTAMVNCEIDENPDNNTAQATVRVLSKNVLPAPVITGEVVGRSVTLTWTNPRGHIVDGAEDYVPFTYSGMGGWMMYDGDMGDPQKADKWASLVDFPNWDAKKSFIVMNPLKAGFNRVAGGDKFYPHSGNQYFAAWWTTFTDEDGEEYQVPNDDWMISPKLNGMQQTIKFWARGYKDVDNEEDSVETNHAELMRVLSTYTQFTSLEEVEDAGEENWVVLKDTFEVDNTAWTEYSVELPYGTQHFALQCCSQNGFVLMVDDISFSIPHKVVSGYKIYRNGMLAGLAGSTGTSFTDAAAVEGNVYTVTAIYEEGESLPSNAFVYGTIQVLGDVNGDGVIDVSDISNTIDLMTSGTYSWKADANSDGVVDVADIAELISLMAGN
jgi:hypothetical protein